VDVAVLDCLLKGFEPLEAGSTSLPDPDDRHVLAATNHCDSAAFQGTGLGAVFRRRCECCGGPLTAAASRPISRKSAGINH